MKPGDRVTVRTYHALFGVVWQAGTVMLATDETGATLVKCDDGGHRWIETADVR